MINDISSVSSDNDRGNKSFINHKYSVFFNNLVSNEIKERKVKKSDTLNSFSSRVHYKSNVSGKRSTVVSNNQTIKSMRNDSRLISEIFEEESDDEIQIKASNITLVPK